MGITILGIKFRLSLFGTILFTLYMLLGLLALANSIVYYGQFLSNVGIAIVSIPAGVLVNNILGYSPLNYPHIRNNDLVLYGMYIIYLFLSASMAYFLGMIIEAILIRFRK